MSEPKINVEYIDWLYDKVCRDRFSNNISYWKLFNKLWHTKFRWLIAKDENRAKDGIALRHRFRLTIEGDDMECYIDGSCTVLEMLIALAIRMEEDIMFDPHIGDRTGQWFWQMINNLGLSAMTDKHFDEREVDVAICGFLNRSYGHDGKGGLFRVRGCKRDMRKVEIWIQMLWYLDTFT